MQYKDQQNLYSQRSFNFSFKFDSFFMLFTTYECIIEFKFIRFDNFNEIQQKKNILFDFAILF